ncbi:MAG: helix-turn-helix domain-containing protein, partial [Candidatus Aenigmatarchaeota archaeon]
MNEEENNDVNNLDKIIVAKRIAGDIVLSSEPGKTIQKWRNIFKVSQKKLADKIGVMPSVISDYENGRRQSPGIKMIRKIVNALIEIDEKYGGKVIKEFINMPNKTNKFSSIIDVADFRKGITIKDFCKVLDAIIIVGNENIENKIYGYTIVDTMKAILELPSIQFIQLYSLTNNRAII